MSTLNNSNHRSAASDGTRRDNSAKTQTATPRLSRMKCFVRSILLCLAITIFSIFRSPVHIEQNPPLDIEVKIDDSIITGPLQPKRTRIQDLDHFYIFPPANATSDGKPKGVLLHLHSCKESGLDFFTQPEHRIVAYEAIQKGLVVFSPTSYDRESGCYTLEDTKGLLKKIVKEFLRKKKLRSLPMVGLGHSSGGTFLAFLQDKLKLQSMALYNSPEDYGAIHSKNNTLIPTVYITMSSDESLSHRMNDNLNRLQNRNITSHLYKVSPKPFTQRLCVTRLPELKKGFCEHMFSTIKSDKAYSDLLDADGYVLESDVATKKWQGLFEFLELAYEGFCPLDDETGDIQYYNNHDNIKSKCWMRVALEQEIKTCYGYHAMTSQNHNEIINFLVSNSEMK